MAHIIMVASGKGGTGKSTVATYLALELALKGHKTFLTELDVGLRSIDLISGISDKAVYDIGDVLQGDCPWERAVVTSPHTSKLHIMPAPGKKSGVKFENLKSLTDRIYMEYEYIIVDTAAGLGDAFYAAVGVAHSAIIVCTADMVSVRDARIVSDEIFYKGVKDIRLVINKYDKNTFRHSGYTDADQIIDACCAQLVGVIPFDVSMQVAAMDGKMLQQDSQTKRIFTAIADRLQGKHSQMIIR